MSAAMLSADLSFVRIFAVYASFQRVFHHSCSKLLASKTSIRKMKTLLILSFIVLHNNTVQACLSTSRHQEEISKEPLQHNPKPKPFIIAVKKPEEKKPKKIELTSKLRTSSFQIEWTIENFETLALVGAKELRSKHSFLQNPDRPLDCNYKVPKIQCAGHIFQIVCQPHFENGKIQHLDFQLKKLKFEDVVAVDEYNEGWKFDTFPTFGYFSFNAGLTKYYMIRNERGHKSYLGSSRDTEELIKFGIEKPDEITFRIIKEDIYRVPLIRRKNLRVSVNLSILFES